MVPLSSTCADPALGGLVPVRFPAQMRKQAAYVGRDISIIIQAGEIQISYPGGELQGTGIWFHPTSQNKNKKILHFDCSYIFCFSCLTLKQMSAIIKSN